MSIPVLEIMEAIDFFPYLSKFTWKKKRLENYGQWLVELAFPWIPQAAAL